MDIKIERIFDAPVEKVWQAWTAPEQIMKWFGPKDWTTPVVKSDFRVGGTSLYCMRGSMAPGEPLMDTWSGGAYKEIVPMQKIVTTDYFTDEEGRKISASDIGMPGEWPEEMQVTTTFEDVGGKTKVTLLHEGHPAEMAEPAKAGWNESLDKLAEILK